MEADLKVTTEQDESSFIDVVDGNNVINIPLFQRAYRWTKTNITQFWDDIDEIRDGSSSSQFLGVLVLVALSRKVGQPSLFDVVDGQQRLTTCYLSVLAIAQVAIENEDQIWAMEVIRTHLLTRRFAGYSTNTKLVPSAADRQQFKTIWDRILSLKQLEGHDWGGDEPCPPQPSGNLTGKMTTAYNLMLRHTRDMYKQQEIEALEEFLDILINRLSFVQINLRDPIAAPTIFERLNARGEKISTSDLVRNEVFGRVADDPSKAKGIFDSEWEPFARRYRTREIDLEKLLFPYGLTHSSSLTKAGLFQALRLKWSKISDPKLIIRDLDYFSPCIFALEKGDVSELPGEEFPSAVFRLHKLGAPSSIYPVLFSMMRAIIEREIDEKAAIEICTLLESFLFRRAVCGIEPTGLHAVFKGLWAELQELGGPSEAAVSEAIKKRTTVAWPNSDEFRTAIISGNFYKRNAAKFGLWSYELECGGESPADDFQIEHIYPQRPDSSWDIEDDDEAEKIRNTWGNLIPLTVAMNPALGNGVFSKKVAEYQHSIFASAREVAKSSKGPGGEVGELPWSLKTIIARSEKLADWAAKRWPHH
jgi:hypothetical protein